VRNIRCRPRQRRLYTKLVSIWTWCRGITLGRPDAYTTGQGTFTSILDTVLAELSMRLSLISSRQQHQHRIGDAPTTLHSPNSIDMNAFFSARRMSAMPFAMMELEGDQGPLSTPDDHRHGAQL